MHYSMTFKVGGLHDPNRVEMLKVCLNKVDGIQEVQVLGPSILNIVYNPIRVIPGRIISILSSANLIDKKG